jgi:hypothetical protein
MNRKLFSSALVASVCLATVAGAIAVAQQSKDSKPGQAEVKLPPGWTEADMQACVIAGTPGKMHEHLAKQVGTWKGNCTMWMAPGAEPVKSECASKVATIMDGRYTKMEFSGELPGMGPYSGLGISGFDNVSQKFVATWIDNHSTGIMTGTGELSPDGKTLTWNYTYSCPIAKKPVTMRQIDTMTSPTALTLEAFGPDPKSGKEFKMMKIELTKK